MTIGMDLSAAKEQDTVLEKSDSSSVSELSQNNDLPVNGSAKVLPF